MKADRKRTEVEAAFWAVIHEASTPQNPMTSDRSDFVQTVEEIKKKGTLSERHIRSAVSIGVTRKIISNRKR